MSSQKLSGIDFIRCICTLLIVGYHFSGVAISSASSVFQQPRFAVGVVAVGIFFMISGSVMWWNYPVVNNIRNFYYKRAKSLFPMFWVAYLSTLLMRLSCGYISLSLLPKSRLLISLIAMDGYTSYLLPNYYLLGEWFLGAIILLYIVYPLLSSCFKEGSSLTYVICLILLLYSVYNWSFTMSSDRSLLYCIAFFCTGMFFTKHKEKIEKNSVLILAIVVLALITFLRYHFRGLIVCYVQAAALYIILYRLGCLIMSNKVGMRLCSFGSKLSYPVFLVHHVIINKILAKWNPESSLYFWLLLILVTIACGITAWLLMQFTGSVQNVISYVYALIRKKNDKPMLPKKNLVFIVVGILLWFGVNSIIKFIL